MATNKEFGYETTGNDVVKEFSNNVKGRTCEQPAVSIIGLSYTIY